MTATTVSIEDSLAIVTLARPQQRNAMSTELVTEMLRTLETIEQDQTVGAVLLRGEGKGFCAGSDIAGLADMDDAGRKRFEAESGLLARRIIQLSKPVVAAVHGFAIGGGLTLAVSCDIVVTDPGSRWSLPEVPIGLFPAWGLDQVIVRTGLAFARRLSWGIDMLDGKQAVASGLADILADDVEGKATEICKSLCELPGDQAAAVKQFFSDRHDYETADIQANRLFMAATKSEAAQNSFERYSRK